MKVAHLRYYLGAALFAALVGIAVNALLLQRERHPAPLFGYAAPKLPSAAARASPAASLKSPSARKTTPRPRSPPPLFRRRGRLRAAGSSPSASDPIAELLAGEAHGDGSRLILAAQTALAKLGYPVKPDGKEGAATEQALREFERAHGLPPGDGNNRTACQAADRRRSRRGTLSSVRLRSDIWVAAYLRRCGVEGVSAVLAPAGRCGGRRHLRQSRSS